MDSTLKKFMFYLSRQNNSYKTRCNINTEQLSNTLYGTDCMEDYKRDYQQMATEIKEGHQKVEI